MPCRSPRSPSTPAAGSSKPLLRVDDLEASFSAHGLVAFTRETERDGHTRYDVYVVRSDGRKLHRIGPGREPAWAPSGRTLAFVRRSALYVASRPRWKARPLPGASPTRHPAWSPDGRLIAFDRVAPTGGGLYVVDARSPAAPVALSGFAGIDLSVPSWSPDGGTIAFSSGFQLFVARLATRSTRLVAGGERPALAPDGSTIAFVRGCGADLIPAGATASPDRSSCGIPELEVPWAPAWAPDGARLAFATCYLWRCTTKVAAALRGNGLGPWTPLAEGGEPAWSRDGRKLLVVRGDSAGALRIWVVDAATGRGRPLLRR